MDGDNRRMKQHDPSSFSSRSGIGRRPVPRPSAGAGATDRFRQPTLQPTRGDPGDLSQATGRTRMPTYADYGYTDTTSFQGGSLQPDELQPYAATDFARHQQQALREQHQRQHQQQVQQQFAPYEPDMVYHLNQPGQSAGSPYEVVPQYPTRQTAAIEALSSQFGVPQYFPPAEQAGTGVPAVVSPYLNPQLPPAAYNQPGPIGRVGTAQHFPASMADFTPVATTGRLEQQSPQQQQQQQPAVAGAPESMNLGEAYNQFQQALRGTFDHARAGRLVEASRSLLEISEWLVANSRELGILRDDQLLYSDRLQLWNDFNICWLSVCQKQKDMTTDLLQIGHQPPNTSLLGPDVMDNMAKGLIQLCDKMEQHGLVDYQMGIWEEEILSVLTQCLDLLESRADMLHGHTVAAPAAAASRS